MLLSPLGERLGEGVLQEVAFALTPSPNLSPQGGEEHEYDAGLEARGPARLAPGNPEIGDGRADKDLRLRGWPDAHAPLETLDARTRRRGQLAPGRGAVELLQQALVIIGVLIAGAAAEARARRRRGGEHDAVGLAHRRGEEDAAMAGRHDHDGGPPAAPGIEGAAQVGRLDRAFGGTQDDAALVAVTGNEDQARLAAAAAQRARHIGGSGDLERRTADRV